jgi:hypothetical protein
MASTDQSVPTRLLSVRRWGLAVVVVAAGLVYWLTAYPTITWWDSSSYSLAAVTLGVTPPPGSLLLTLAGWLVTRLPLGVSDARALNLFAGLMAALTAGLAYLVALRLMRYARREGDEAPRHVAGAALGALAFAFTATLWEHALKFTPYVLTAVFTGMILWTMVRWWEAADHPGAWRWMPVLGMLFGLDFSVHRTNALLLPGLLVWILLRRPATLWSARAWLGGIGGLAAGLAVQLLIMPLSASRPLLNMGDPSTWTRFWDYVSLQQHGGGFLVRFFPRNAPFWSVQVGDFLHVLGANFLRLTAWGGPLGALPALAGVLGIGALCRSRPRLGVAFLLVLLLSAAATVLFFNIPPDYFRPFDRHYLPVCVTFAVAVALGFGVLADAVAASHRRRGWSLAAAGALAAALAPVGQLLANWRALDVSDRFFTADYAANALRGLPANAILFTNGDNDTFPLWYLQEAEGVRPDVRVVNLTLTNASWYLDHLLARDPSFPISLTPDQRRALAPRVWTDTTIVIPVVGTAERLGLAAGTPVLTAIRLGADVEVGTPVFAQDLIVLNVIEANRWRRPVCFAITVAGRSLTWVEPHTRLDGIFRRVVPAADPPVDLETLRTNLLERYRYRGYGQPAARIDDVSRGLGAGYYLPLTTLLEAERERGNTAGCLAAAAHLADLVAPLDTEGAMPGLANARLRCDAPP